MFSSARNAAILSVLVPMLVACSPPRCRASGGRPPKDEAVPGAVRDVGMVATFSRAAAPTWKVRAGSNVTSSVQFGYDLPGVAPGLLAATVARKDPVDRDASHNWFAVAREGLPAGAIPQPLDGLRFRLGSRTELQWWISASLVTDSGESYSHVIVDGSFPARRIVEFDVPIGEFRTAKGEALSAAEAPRIRGISFATSSPGTTLYIGRISAYRRDHLSYWLEFGTSHPATNLFQRVDPVSLTFTPGGAIPADAAGFRYEIRDFFGRLTTQGWVRLTDARSYVVRATPRTHGYYEVAAFLTDSAGRSIARESCIRGDGTVPAGIGTFAVLPTTIAGNVARFRKLGQNAFFGLHGDFLGMADAIGLPWRFGYSFWRPLEPTKPNRSSGPAPWSNEQLARPPEPAYRLHIHPFTLNFASDTPDWARSDGPQPPPFEHWSDALAMVRDSVRVEKHLYPHMNPRIYGGGWEINLNMQPYVSAQPEYQPADVAELYRRVRQVVKAEDPRGIVAGPCANVLSIPWFENVFRAGVLKYVDAVETHGYAECFTPEVNDYPGKLAKLRALVRRYKGHDLPIYVTELGQPGMLGSQVDYRSQAERMTRTAIILKGEGVRAFLPFYGIDYDWSGYWGFCFNRDIDLPPNPWATKHISPKPMVNAMAVCALMLEGSRPVRRIRTLGPDAWAYAFRKGNGSITAVWTPGQPETVSLSVDGRHHAEVVDMMGHSSRVSASGGAIRIRIGTSPVYVVAR